MTLEDYFRYEYAQGKIDFSVRVNCYGAVELYIHPTGQEGTTTPTLLLEGNTVRLHPGSSAPGWSHDAS